MEPGLNNLHVDHEVLVHEAQRNQLVVLLVLPVLPLFPVHLVSVVGPVSFPLGPLQLHLLALVRHERSSVEQLLQIAQR